MSTFLTSTQAWNPRDEEGGFPKVVKIPLEREMEDLEESLEDAFDDILDPFRIERFLGRSPELEDTLLDTARVLRDYYPDSELLLRHEFDPEFESQGQVVIGVRTGRAPEDALKRLDRFDEQWWLLRSNTDRKKICIIMEYV